jgi:transcriptional regulator with XRE-family HTH domain
VQLNRPTIGAFLKEHRRLVPREATALGSHARHPVRYGKLVTQDEVAEAVGVSSVWYAMLESGAAMHASPRLLARLADALSLSDERREALFRLGLPELSPRDSSFPVLKDLSASIAPLRTAARRVLSATTESEVLVAVTEALAALFRDADFVGISVKGRIDSAFESAGFETANFIDARVKSREGYEATLFANYVTGNRKFSELDRSLLGTLADIASLALSRGVT